MDDLPFWLLSRTRHELATFAQAGFLLFGLEQFAFDAIWIVRAGWRSVTVYRRNARVTMATLAPPARPGRFAVLIGAWDEAAVIGTTLATARTRWMGGDYRIYVATYPNDPATLHAIEAVRTDDDARRTVRVVPGDRDGPVTKAEALNRAWAALRADEAVTGH